MHSPGQPVRPGRTPSACLPRTPAPTPRLPPPAPHARAPAAPSAPRTPACALRARLPSPVPAHRVIATVPYCNIALPCLSHNTMNYIATQSSLLPAFLLQYTAVYCDTIHPPSLQYKPVYCNTIFAHPRFLTAIQNLVLQYNSHSLKIQLGSSPFQICTIFFFVFHYK